MKWAEKYRVLDESSNLSGKWSNDVTPYLVEIMNTLNEPHIREVYLCKGSQLGGKEPDQYAGISHYRGTWPDDDCLSFG